MYSLFRHWRIIIFLKRPLFIFILEIEIVVLEINHVVKVMVLLVISFRKHLLLIFILFEIGQGIDEYLLIFAIPCNSFDPLVLISHIIFNIFIFSWTFIFILNLIWFLKSPFMSPFTIFILNYFFLSSYVLLSLIDFYNLSVDYYSFCGIFGFGNLFVVILIIINI